MARAIDVSIDAREFSQLLGKASTLDAEIKKGLRKSVRQAAQVGQKASKAEVLKPPLQQGRRPTSRGLRRGISSGIKIQIKAGASSSRVGAFIVSTGGGLGGSRRQLARRWDSEGAFRHPVFGNRNVWVSQRGRPYFRTVINEHRAEIERLIRRALEDAKRSVT